MNLSRILSTALVLWALAGCGPGQGVNQNGSTNAPNERANQHGAPQPTSDSHPPRAHPNYLGGPLLQNARVASVYWDANVNYMRELDGFYKAVTKSAYFASLAEYGTETPRQTINLGTFIGSAIGDGSLSGNLVRNADIQHELSRMIANGTVPKNDPDTIYMVHLPPGKSVEFDGTSCSDFCSYHSTFQRNGANVYYVVIPDMGGACSNACGPSSQLGNTTAAASHELAETVTDPAVGLAADYGPPLGWYDEQAGEIGDPCNGQRAVVLGFTVQPLWSNAENRCRTY